MMAQSFRAPWVSIVAFLLLLISLLAGAGWTAYATLDAKKADRDAVAEIRQDVREIRNYLLGPSSRPNR